MKIIDPHIHLFDLALGQYQWLKPANAPHWPDKAVINKNFSEQDLHLSQGLSLAGFVHIEAGFDNQQPSNESAWLEQQCQQPFASIAFADLTLPSEQFAEQLTQLQQYSSVVGIRHILDEDAQQLLANPQCINNLNQLAQSGLLFECQLCLSDNQAIKRLHEVITQNPDLNWIINHAGFPPTVQPLALSDWYKNLSLLADCPNLAVKCSGWEMTDRKYQNRWLIEVINLCVAALGEQRVMLASNFPLCLFNQSYQHYWENILTVLKQCAGDGVDNTTLTQALCFDNAKHWYKLKRN
jgi:predicted TIM-barrel fold metal-dependent hydrolase